MLAMARLTSVCVCVWINMSMACAKSTGRAKWLSRLRPVPLVRRGEIDEHDGVGGVATLGDAGADDAGRGVGEGDAGVASTGAYIGVNNKSFCVWWYKNEP